MPSPDSIRILSVIVPIILLAIGIKRPVFAVVAYMVLVYCKVSSYYPFAAAMKAELFFGLLILLMVLFAGNFGSKISLKYNLVNKYLFFFIIAVFVSFLMAWNQQYSWDNAVYHFIKVLILFVLICTSIENIKDLKIFVWSFVIMFSYLAYEPIYYFLTGTSGSQQMYGTNYVSDIGILAGHVALANNMNQMIPIAFFLLFTFQNKILKILSCIPLVLFFIALMGSGSRGGLIGLMVFGMVVIYYSKRRVIIGILFGVAIVVLFVTSESVKSTSSRIDESSITARLLGLTHGIEILKRGNVLGVGPGCFLFARGKYFGYTMESHNIYGQVIGDLGIPGIIAWFYLMRQIFRNLIAAKKKLKSLSMESDFLYKLAIGVQVSLIVRLVISLASHGLYYFYWYVMAAISIALVKMVENMEENANKDKPISNMHALNTGCQ